MPSRSIPKLTRDLPLQPHNSALLIIDVQNHCCHPDGGMFKTLSPTDRDLRYGDYLREIKRVTIPHIRRVISACRGAGIEVVYSTIEALTTDGRDQSLDYKISGILIPKGTWGAQVIDEIAPRDDEIRIPKTASSVFNATNVEYVLRNLGVERLAICGVLTDQCVESAVRDACDRGFLTTLVTDACATFSAERHRNSLAAIKGYCRQITTEQFVDELNVLP